MNYDVELDQLRIKDLDSDSDERANFIAIADSLQKIQEILYDINQRLENGGL